MPNLKKFLGKLLVLVTIAVVSPQHVQAYSSKEGNVSLLLGSFFSRTNFNGSETLNRSPWKGDLGFLVIGDINERGSLELGLFHMHKLYVREDLGKYQAEETELVHMTMGYRRWIGSTFSASLTFFSSYSIGDPRVVHSDFASGSAVDTSARDITEYGFDGALSAELWSADKMSLMTELRYSKSVTPKPNELADHYGVFIGLRIQAQEKQAPPAPPPPVRPPRKSYN